MPYIKQERRIQLDIPDGISSPDYAGELNYKITCLCRNYCQEHGLSYARINDVLGALEGAKAEFYRRVAVPYEDMKIAENGDVYS